MMRQPGLSVDQVLQQICVLVFLGVVLATNLGGNTGRAYGQQAFGATGWGGGRHTQPFDPELFSDYLLSGQTPHAAVARIIAPESSGVSLGSGVLVDINGSQGLVLTNWHVIRDSRSAGLVQFADGFQSAGTVIRFDEAWDLAAISIWKPKTTPVQLAPRNPLQGEALCIAGYGRGAYREQRGRCTEYLSPGSGYPKELVELQAPARQGDSGGPILDTEGRLAGVLFGEGDGKTIGSCVSRLRIFLASVGSDGFQPPAHLVAQKTMPQQIQNQAPQSLQQTPRPARAAQQGVRVYPAAVSALGQPTQQAGQVYYQPVIQQPVTAWSLIGDLHIPDAVWAQVNLFTNTKTVLTALGGLSLMLFGLRLIWRSRQRAS